MISKKNIFVASAALAAAAGVGFALQNGGAIAERFSAKPAFAAYASDDAAEPWQTDLPAYLPAPPTEAILPIALHVPDITGATRVAAVTMVIETEVQSDAPTPVLLAASCDVGLTALPEPGAMVRLQLNAPCYQNQRITVSHAGLEFADTTGGDGAYSVAIPAMNAFAPFAVSFADGRSVQAKTLKLALDGYERVAISWSGAPALHVHAMEFGAAFGETGHIWADATTATKPGGGRLIQLGNPDVLSPKLAEVYTVRSDDSARYGTIELLVEAEVNAQTCGREISGHAFQLAGNGRLTSTSIAFSLPPCGGENGYLHLNNLFQDLIIARN